MNHGMRVHRILVQWLQMLIAFYQRTLSPDHGYMKVFFPYGVCRYQPTCSHYFSQALARYGLYGILPGITRLCRCHPWSRGGFDPLV